LAPSQLADDGQNALSFLLFGHRRADSGTERRRSLRSRRAFRGDHRRPRPRGLAPDVDEAGARGQKLLGVCHGLCRIEIKSGVGERVGRDVHHAHDQGTPAEFENPRADVPLEYSPHVPAILNGAIFPGVTI
jgi:hypothetical protein